MTQDSGGFDGRALAGSPTFAIMALQWPAHISPLSGMVTMYLLMSAFREALWLKLIRGERPPV